MKYKYVGTTRQQEEITGIVDASDEFEARMKLRSMQVRPISVKASGPSFDLGKLTEISFGPPIDLKGILVFTRQFASLIDAGVSVVQCFEILAEQEKRSGFKKVLLQIKGDIEAGASLTDALKKHKNVFSNMYCSLVEAGEVSGTLEINLRRIAKSFEKTDRIRAKVKSALMYPIATLIVSVFVLVFLLLKVVPEVSKLYMDAKAQLPDLTVMVLGLSKWVEHYYVVLMGGILGTIIGSVTLYKVPAVREMVDPLILYIPLFGPLIQKSAITRFARTLATLVSSGVPLLNAFEVCERLIGNRAIAKVIKRTASLVSEGKTIAFGLGEKKGIFPPMVVHMVSIGEVTGKMDELLEKLADIYEDEVNDAVTNITSMIQPVLIVIVGGIIAFLLMAMYLPIFQLAEKVTGGL